MVPQLGAFGNAEDGLLSIRYVLFASATGSIFVFF